MIGIFLISAILRFWRLGQFNTLVFDEVYYAKFANNYLTGTQFFNAHPPLSQYIIAIGIWIGSHLPFGQDITNGLTGSVRSTFSYRWLSAFTGSFIPLLVSAIAYQLTHRRSYALIAAIFLAADGLFLVESRYALNNIYLILFGLLGQLYFLLALSDHISSPTASQLTKGGVRGSLILSGIFFGAAAAIKWNGLGFLLGIYLVWAAAWGIRFRRGNAGNVSTTFSQIPLQNLTQLNLLHIVWYLGIIPVLTYSLSWIPHLLMNPQPGFWQMQREILSFHQRIGSGADVHPYCSHWYSWLVMWRPVAYFYQTARSTSETVPAYPPLPAGTGKVIYDVHAIGNPALWWLSTAAILLLILLLCVRLFRKGIRQSFLTPQTWIALYLVCNYVANFLPWTIVSRCTFLYHYIGASVFAQLGLAWLVARWLRSRQYVRRNAGITVILVILLAFVFWLPIYIGLPLSPEAYQLRMWFPSWT